ncbi:MAG TPA: zinc ribbon domain-containing protein [Gemmatimonadales bacterium]
MSDELDRLFECLVEALARETRLAVPVPASEVYERLVPYRSNRSRLKVATHQDYEMTVLRLLAGERSYVRLEPEDVREGMQREVTSPNPDPAYFRNFPEARVMVNRRAADRFLVGERLYAPPVPDITPAEEPEDVEDDAPPPSVAPLPFSMDGTAPNQCPYCGGSLPAGRKMNFCPHCGQPPSGELKCPACGSEVDVGWAYCVSCGRATGFE